MPSKYLGCDAVPEDIVGRSASRYRSHDRHHYPVWGRLRHHHVISERDLHEWGTSRRYVHVITPLTWTRVVAIHAVE